MTGTLLVALTVTGVAGARLEHNASATLPALAVAACGVLLGIAYYLGRTRPAPGTGQRLTLTSRVLSVIPIFGLILVPGMAGLYRLTRRRLYVRNIAIFAGIALVQLSLQDLGNPAKGLAVTMAILQIAALVLAVLMSRRLPAASPQPTGTAPRRVVSRTQEPSLPAAAVPVVLPASGQIVDVSPLSAGARRLYWLTGSVKFGTIFLVLGILAPHNYLQFTRGKGIIAGLGVLAVLGVAVLMQESWIGPVAGLLLALGLVSVVCFVPVSFGLLTGADALTGAFGWAIWPPLFIWLYWRQRRSSGLGGAQIQAASRVGHLPPRQASGTGRRIPPPALWVRGSIGMVCAIPVMVVGMANTIFNVMVISDWVQAALDKLYALAQGPADTFLAGFNPDQRASVALATSSEPGAWQLVVRGDLPHWGKLGPQRVPFEEFLRARLEAYGDVMTIADVPGLSQAATEGSKTSLVVMPVGVPHSPDVLDAVAVLGAYTPLLLLVQPIGRKPLQRWPLLAQQLHERGVALPAIDDPGRAIGVLHQVTGKNTVYVAQKRNQWGYIAAIHEAIGTINTEGHSGGRRLAI